MSQHSNLARCLQYIEFEVTVIYSTKYITYRGRDGGTRSFTLDKSSRSSTYGINVIRQFSQRPRDPVLQDNTEPLACHAAQLSLVPLGNHALPPAWPLEASIWITTGWRVVRIGGGEWGRRRHWHLSPCSGYGRRRSRWHVPSR